MQITTSLAANNITELLVLEDVAFVSGAYQTLLNRAPDAVGFNNYLKILRAGSSKMRILTRMRYSKEGRAQNRPLPGLQLMVIKHALASFWLTGWWFRVLTGVEGETPIECRIRSIQISMMRLAEEKEREFEQVEASVSDVTRLLKAYSKSAK